MERYNGKNLALLTMQNGLILLYSGVPTDCVHRSGVGILLTKIAWKSLTERHSISDRVTLARFQAKIKNVIIIQRYTPTEDAHNRENIKCYMLLREGTE
jgi:hypothetical protein